MLRGLGIIVVCSGCRLDFEPRVFDAATGHDASGDGAKHDGAPAASCKTSYTFTYGTSKYRGGGSDQWPNFEADCESDGVGMHLVVIDDLAELDGLAPLAGTAPTWIGISDRVTVGTFLSVTGGTPPVLPWAAGHPTTSTPECVVWEPTTNTFTDEACGNAHPRICECDGIPADPSAY